MEKIILLSVCVCPALFLFISILKMNQQEKAFKKKILMHNKSIIFASVPDLDLKMECFKASEFFCMRNTGNDPCEEVKNIEYKRCFSKKDLYINIKTE